MELEEERWVKERKLEDLILQAFLVGAANQPLPHLFGLADCQLEYYLAGAPLTLLLVEYFTSYA